MQTVTMWVVHSNNNFIAGKANNYEGHSSKIWHLPWYLTAAASHCIFLFYSSAPGDFSPSVLSQNNHYVHLLSAGGVESVYVYVCIAVEGATVRANQVGGHPSLSNHLTLMSLGEMHSYVSS